LSQDVIRRGTRVAKLVRQWQALSFEKKLGGVAVPLAAALIGVGVPMLTSSHASPHVVAPNPPARHENLQVIDLTVSGGESAVSLNEQDKPSRIDLTVRNAGNLVSVIKRIGFRVRATGFVAICQAGGGLEPSRNYNVLLPPHPRLGQVVAYKVSQEIAPGAADRFTLRVDVPEPDRQLGDYIYQLDVLLFHDQDEQAVRAGTVLVSAPFVPDGDFFWSGVADKYRHSYEIPGSEAAKQCLVRNEATYKRMLSLRGERSRRMTTAVLRPVSP
jgi:hypothetical protein